MDHSELDEKLFNVISIYNRTIHTTTKQRPIDFLIKNLSREDIASLAEKFENDKEIRIRRLNRKNSADLKLCKNIVKNRAVAKFNHGIRNYQILKDMVIMLLTAQQKETRNITKNKLKENINTKYPKMK